MIGGSIATLAVFAWSMASATDQQDFSQIERGRYLTIVADCAACHTNPGGEPFAGGRSIGTPFGTLLAPNITPDMETGIGSWSNADFESALKRGISKGGALLYPAMPYVYYTKMPRMDVMAIRAYLNTIKPVKHKVVSNQLPFPFNIRASLIFWNWLYFKKGDWKPDPSKSPEWNRGAYLVEGPMHCGACHTPKSFLGGDNTKQAYEGFTIQGWRAPDITSGKALGIGNWSEEDLVQYLKDGHNSFAMAAGPMAEEVQESSSLMKDADLKAVAVYLMGRPSPDKKPGAAVAMTDPMMKAGEAIYTDQCSACHAKDGRGEAGLLPSLRGVPSVSSPDPISLVRVVVDGVRTASTPGGPTAPGMPSYAWQLNDDQIAAVLTYVRNAWDNSYGPVSGSDVASARTKIRSNAE